MDSPTDEAKATPGLVQEAKASPGLVQGKGQTKAKAIQG